MRKGNFTEEQIIKVLKEHAAGMSESNLPQARHQRCDVLQVAVALWWDGRSPTPTSGGDAGRLDAEEDARKKSTLPCHHEWAL